MKKTETAMVVGGGGLNLSAWLEQFLIDGWEEESRTVSFVLGKDGTWECVPRVFLMR